MVDLGVELRTGDAEENSEIEHAYDHDHEHEHEGGEAPPESTGLEPATSAALGGSPTN
jgi:hypothetical protein